MSSAAAEKAAADLDLLNRKLDELQKKYSCLEARAGGDGKGQNGGRVPTPEQVKEFKAALMVRLQVVQKSLAGEHSTFAKADVKKEQLVKEQAKLKHEIKQALEDLEKAEKSTKKGNSLEVSIPPEVAPIKGVPTQYMTFDDDHCHGQSIPASWQALYDDKSSLWDTPYKLNKKKPVIFLFWAKFHKPGYKFLRLYSLLLEKMHGAIDVVGISTDPKRSFDQEFLNIQKCKFPQVYDQGGKMKEDASQLIRGSLSIPHIFLVSRGTIVWNQNHSQIGTSAPTWMDLVERQAALLLHNKPLQRIGSAPAPEMAEEEDDMPVPDDDFALF